MEILKFGGASVQSPENFLQIADIIARKAEENAPVLVVVSAMAHQTEALIDLAHKVHPEPPKRELDMLVSVGERVSIALLAMALSLKGLKAVSFTGSQSGIITCSSHFEARILEVRPFRLMPVLEEKRIAIVAGFQGVSLKGEITTLGRGGSDTTAVALAVALRAPRVTFYKDVGAVFDRDPKESRDAKPFSFLSYEEALCLAKKGAKVLHPRCIELARKNGIELAISSFTSPEVVGTKIGNFRLQEERIFEGEKEIC